MYPISLDFLAQIMFHGMFLGATAVRLWFLVPLVITISLVYGGTRHETLSEILAHAVRTAVWLIVFLGAIFAMVWLSGFGTASDIMNTWDSQLLLAVMAWVFGTMWIAGAVFQTNTIAGLGCFLTGGIMALVIGLQSCNLLPLSNRKTQDTENEGSKHVAMWFPVILMVGALGWALVALWMRS